MPARARGESPSAQAIESQLAKILASEAFAGSGRSCALLRFTVGKTLAGDTGALKETVLGVEIFHRKPDFDPQATSVVRVEFTRLRKKLEEYYQSQGKTDFVRIIYPKGSYVPEFRQRENGPAKVTWKSSLAVLPLVHSGSDEDEYFADGLTEDLITALTRVAGLRVVSRTSSFALKGKANDVREIGRVLQVNAVVEGSVRRQKDQLRIHVRLISVHDGCQIWAEKYERKLTDVFEVQDEITTAIVEALEVELPRMQGGVTSTQRPPVAAHDLYLKGRYWWHRSSPEGQHRAAEFFREAIACDPAYALPYAGLSDALWIQGVYGYVRPRESMPAAEAAARKALELDSTLVEAHCALGVIENAWNWDSARSEAEFQQCFEINPGYALALAKYGTSFLNPLRRYEESYHYVVRALELDPLSPSTHADLALNFAYRSLFDLFDKEAAKVLDMNPSISKVHWYTMITAGIRGDWATAIKAAEAAQRAGCDDVYTIAQCAWTYAGAGHKQRAQQIRRELAALSEKRYIPGLAQALAELQFGDERAYFAHLERALEERDSLIRYLWQWHPVMQPSLYSDPRFLEVMRRVGLA